MTPQEQALEKKRRALEGADPNAAPATSPGKPSAGLAGGARFSRPDPNRPDTQAAPARGPDPNKPFLNPPLPTVPLPRAASAATRANNPNFPTGQPAPNADPNRPYGAAPAPAAAAVPVAAPVPVSRVGNPNFPDGMPRTARGADPNRPGDLSAPAPTGAPAPRTRAPAAPGGFGRAVGDVVAMGADAVLSTPKMVLDGANRAAIGVRNIAADAVGAANVQPTRFNYRQTQDGLAELRARNANGGAGSTPTTAAAPAPVAAAPGKAPVAASAAAVATGDAQRAPARSRQPEPTGQRPLVVSPMAGAPEPLRAGVGANGENVYDNTSIAKLEARNAAGQSQNTGSGDGSGNNFGTYFQPAAPTASTFQRPGPYDAPGTDLRGNLAGANAERLAAISDLDSKIRGLGSLDSRGKRAMFETLVSQRTNLQRDGFGQQGELAKTAAVANVSGANNALDANSRADENAAQLGAQAGENAEQRKLSREQLAQQAELSGEMVGGANGRKFVRRGSKVTPVTDAEGKGFQGQPDKVPAGQITPEIVLKSMDDQLAALDNITDPDFTQRDKIQAQRAALLAGAGFGGGSAEPQANSGQIARNPKTGERVRLNAQTGQWEPIQ